MRAALITLLTLLSTYWQFTATAQQPIFKNYTVNDGLISNSIRQIFQDSKGFLWIATWEGLSKYDGHRFHNYNTANGLSHNMVNDFYESSDGKIFVALNSGHIDLLKNNTIQKEAFSHVVVNRFITTPGQPVLAVTDQQGVQEFSNEKFIVPAQPSSNTYLDLCWLNDSTFISITDSVTRIFNNHYQLVSESSSTQTFYTRTKIFRDLKHRIWVGTSTGLKLIKSLLKKDSLQLIAPPAPFNVPPLVDKKINDIYEEADGTLWFATISGLVKVNPDNSHQLITVSQGLASNIVNCIFQDREKNIWFGTALGLSKLVTRAGIKWYPIENGIYSSDNLFILYPVKKTHLLLSTQQSLKLLNTVTGVFSSLKSSGDNIYYSVVSNTNPPLFMGYSAMARFDTTRLQLTNATPLPALPAIRIMQLNNGSCFFSNENEFLFKSGNNRQVVLNVRISALMMDRRGALWAGTWKNGLYRIQYYLRDNQLHILKKEQFLPNENIRCLYEDSKGNIWAGTRYQGVYHLIHQPNDDFRFINYDQSKGLTSNFIRGVREDGHGNLWIAFYQGLDKLIVTGRKFRVFNFSRTNNFFASVIGMETMADHSVWLATNEGLVSITDGRFEELPPLPVFITKVTCGDSIFTTLDQPLQLTHEQKQVLFEFSSPGFINEKQLFYSYRLSGHSSTDWTNPANQNIVSYASLSPGSYTFEVRALGWNGKWGAHSTVEFTIAPPFWKTWWFLFCCIFTVGVITLMVIRKRISDIRHQASMKQKIAETEMIALRAQMNPHFIFNCLNSIDNLIQLDEKEKATAYLSKFAKLIRAILENSTDNLVPCWKDMETLQLYLELESLRFDKKFIYKVNIDPQILSGDYKVPPLIIQPFVENAIQHGLLNKVDPDRRLQVDVVVSDNQIRYQVLDNGVGRARSAEYRQLNKPAHQSLGILITGDRICLYNSENAPSVEISDLFDEQGQPAGTKVTVTLFYNP